jgi:predicted transposase YbfD/YdcC
LSTTARSTIRTVPCKTPQATQAARKQWGIENELHWVLDVVFREDDRRVRAGNAAENFGVMRHLPLNLLKSVNRSRTPSSASNYVE